MANELNQLSPEDYAQQQQINRQQKMAQMLMSQNQQPQGQMVSGRFVAPSFFQNILPLVNTYVGKSMLEEGDVKQQKLAEELRKREISDIQKYQEMYRGTPDYKPAVKSLLAKDDQGYAMPNVENQVGQAANPNAANLFAATSYSAPLRAMGLKKLTEGPKWEKADLPQADGTVKHGWVDYNSPNPKDTFVEGGVKPAMSAYEKAQLERKEFEWNNLSADQKARLKNEAARIGMTAQQLFYDTGLGGGGAYVVPNQTTNPIQRQSTTVPPINQQNTQQNTNYGNPIINKQSNNIPPYAQTALNLNTAITPNNNASTNMPYMTPKQQAEANKEIYVDKTKKQNEFAMQAPAAIESMKQVISNVNNLIGDTKVVKDPRTGTEKLEYGKIKPHAGFENAVGYPSYLGAGAIASLFPGTKTTDFAKRFEQIGGETFLQAYNILKGSGQITEIEGAKATAALNRMSRSQSEVEFVKAAREFQESVERGMELAQNRAGMTPTQSNTQSGGNFTIKIKSQ
jgi:hypothetical protein